MGRGACEHHAGEGVGGGKTPERYRLMKDSKLEPEAKAGTTVYRCLMHDYSMADLDRRMTGVPHISVTLRQDGDYPFFTVPEPDLERI